MQSYGLSELFAFFRLLSFHGTCATSLALSHSFTHSQPSSQIATPAAIGARVVTNLIIFDSICSSTFRMYVEYIGCQLAQSALNEVTMFNDMMCSICSTTCFASFTGIYLLVVKIHFWCLFHTNNENFSANVFPETRCDAAEMKVAIGKHGMSTKSHDIFAF